MIFLSRKAVQASFDFVITNPKRRQAPATGRDHWFPYYAGFSEAFACALIKSSGLRPESMCMDPWNGSGTSTTAAALHGYRAFGFDINPVMAIVAKARLLPRAEHASVAPLLADILKKAKPSSEASAVDPLLTWFMPDATKAIRAIERAIHVLLVSVDPTPSYVETASTMSSLAAFFYVALFRAVRSIMKPFKASNPTWITRPDSPAYRILPSKTDIHSAFAAELSAMSSILTAETGECKLITAECKIAVGSSDALPVPDSTVDFVLTSPPYCTRIDYGIATSPELAVLGFPLDEQLRELRAMLIGTPTIRQRQVLPVENWGTTCNSFLEGVAGHPSKAARSYYYKTYVQYFSAIASSMAEITRCLTRQGLCVMVVQDSYFKDLRADLALIFTEIASGNGLNLFRRVDFPMSRTFVSINTKSRRYRPNSPAVESVLCFSKN